MTPRRAIWIAIAAFWMLFGIVTGLQVWLSMIAHGHSLARLVGYYILVWEGWLLISAVIVRVVRRLTSERLSATHALLHALLAMIMAVAHGTYSITLTVVMRPYDRMTPGWADYPVSATLFGRLPLELILYFVVAAGAYAAEYYSRSARLETSLAHARLDALELQLQPHFLFNTLNAISSLVRAEQNREAVTMIAGLSELLRCMLDHRGQQLISLEEEGRMLQRYLEIQRMRFPDRLTFAIDIAADVRSAAVPVFILQPLAENAIRHGIAERAEGGIVRVRASGDAENVRIEIFNSGTLRGEPATTGIGIENTRERLRQLFGSRQNFEIASADGGVVASITIPRREVVCAR